MQLEPYDKRWDEIALQTIKTLKSILGDDAIDIQHIGSTAIQAIRDYLNANENVALQYQKLKQELESKYADDRVTYTNGKQDMIDIILNCNSIIFMLGNIIAGRNRK